MEDWRIFKDHHGFDQGFLGVDLRAEADLLALVQGGISQDFPHSLGVLGGLLGVKVLALDDRAVFSGEVQGFAALQVGQGLGLLGGEDPLGDVHVSGSFPGVDAAVFFFIDVGISRRDEGGLPGLAVDGQGAVVILALWSRGLLGLALGQPHDAQCQNGTEKQGQGAFQDLLHMVPSFLIWCAAIITRRMRIRK